ncbi:fructose-bisphosphate aldolase, partial [Mycobacterium sp. ITM-2017-0098]
ETLIDPETHLVFDGIMGGSLVRAQYTYCQGVVLGVETELAARALDDAVGGHLLGDGGLFHGILARYLALVVTTLPGDSEADVTARDTASTLVLLS